MTKADEDQILFEDMMAVGYFHKQFPPTPGRYYPFWFLAKLEGPSKAVWMVEKNIPFFMVVSDSSIVIIVSEHDFHKTIKELKWTAECVVDHTFFHTHQHVARPS